LLKRVLHHFRSTKYKMSGAYSVFYASSRYAYIQGPDTDTGVFLIDVNTGQQVIPSLVSTADGANIYQISNLVPSTSYSYILYKSGPEEDGPISVITSADIIGTTVSVASTGTIRVDFYNVNADQTTPLDRLDLSTYPVSVLVQDGNGNYTVPYTDVDVANAESGYILIDGIVGQSFMLSMGWNGHLETSAPFSYSPNITLTKLSETETSITLQITSGPPTNDITALNNVRMTNVSGPTLSDISSSMYNYDSDTNQLVINSLTPNSSYDIVVDVSTPFGSVSSQTTTFSTASPPVTIYAGTATLSSLEFAVESASSILDLYQVLLNGSPMTNSSDIAWDSATSVVSLKNLVYATTYSVAVVVSTPYGYIQSNTVSAITESPSITYSAGDITTSSVSLSIDTNILSSLTTAPTVVIQPAGGSSSWNNSTKQISITDLSSAARYVISVSYETETYGTVSTDTTFNTAIDIGEPNTSTLTKIILPVNSSGITGATLNYLNIAGNPIGTAVFTTQTNTSGYITSITISQLAYNAAYNLRINFTDSIEDAYVYEAVITTAPFPVFAVDAALSDDTTIALRPSDSGLTNMSIYSWPTTPFPTLDTTQYATNGLVLITGLTPSTPYTFSVYGEIDGMGDATSEITTTTKSTPPSVVTLTQTGQTLNTITFSLSGYQGDGVNTFMMSGVQIPSNRLVFTSSSLVVSGLTANTTYTNVYLSSSHFSGKYVRTSNTLAAASTESVAYSIVISSVNLTAAVFDIIRPGSTFTITSLQYATKNGDAGTYSSNTTGVAPTYAKNDLTSPFTISNPPTSNSNGDVYVQFTIGFTGSNNETGINVIELSYSLAEPGSGSGSDAVPCIPAGQRILTQRGLVPVEALRKGDRLATADGRLVDFKLYKTVLTACAEKNAPIRIERGATAVELSPLHMIQVRRGVWVKPAELLAAGVRGVSRVRAGEDVVYYHMEMPDYLRDNMVVEGCVVESFGLPWVHRSGFKGSPYTWNARLNGYTRIASWVANAKSDAQI